MDRFLPRLTHEVVHQIGERRDVEFLALVDNFSMSVGSKWNVLVNAARGQFITVIGDDDLPLPGYVNRICDAVKDHPCADCIVFDTEMYRDGEFIAKVHWGLDYEYRDDWDGKKLWRYPGELMAIRSDIRKKFPYPDVWRGSDWKQARAMRHELEKQYRILDDDGEAAVLYRYLNRSDNDEHIKNERRARIEKREMKMAGLP